MLAVRVGEARVQIGERFSVSFQRTLRIPDDGKVYPLPPGLGPFPVYPANQYGLHNPPQFADYASVLIPLYRLEALWLGFEGAEWKPNAVQVAAGGINALSGEDFKPKLKHKPQNYLVCPDQPWLDGVITGKGVIRQFVATPLGQGHSLEGQLTGHENTGGLQIVAFEPKAGRFPDAAPPKPDRALPEAMFFAPMGAGAGGQMKQKIYPDAYGLRVWDQGNWGGVFVHLVDVGQFEALTGHKPPPSPISAQTYTEHGFPWFDLYDEHLGTLEAAPKLKKVKPLQQLEGSQEEGLELKPGQIQKLKHGRLPKA